MKCYRVLILDTDGHHWQPVIHARDEAHIAAKVENIYPGARVMESFVLHDRHDQWRILYPDTPEAAAIVAGVSTDIDRGTQ